MTGVARKSRGCTTCRRRRIKCDLKFPACQNCTRFNRTCEGYERFPVFINRTAKGVLRRLPLEEAKLFPGRGDGVRTQVDCAPVEPYNTGPQLWSKNLEADRFVAWFLDSSSAGRSVQGHSTKQSSHWLQYVASLMHRQRPLDEALLAVSLIRYGKIYGESAVLGKGRQIYVRALSSLQQCLYDGNTALLDETLATVCVMVLHEILEARSETPEGWSKHVSGFASLLKYRGPQRHRALLPRKLFEHSRYTLMNHSIMQRTGSIFGEQEWKEVPWIGIDKGVEQKVFDHGLRLGSLLEAADTLSKGNSGFFSDVARLSGELAEISNRIQDLRERYSSPGIGSPRSALAETQDSKQPTPAVSPASPGLQIVALGIQLLACATGYAIAIKATNPPALASGPTNSTSPRRFEFQASKEWFDERRTTLALEIYRFSSRCLGKGEAMMGASRFIFPLRLAFEQLETSSDEYHECRDLLQKLEGKGMEFIPALNRNESIASRIIRHKRLFTALKSTKQQDCSEEGFGVDTASHRSGVETLRLQQ